MWAVSRQLEGKPALFVSRADLKHDVSGARRDLKNDVAIFAAIRRNNFVQRVGRSAWNAIDNQAKRTAPEIGRIPATIHEANGEPQRSSLKIDRFNLGR